MLCWGASVMYVTTAAGGLAVLVSALKQSRPVALQAGTVLACALTHAPDKQQLNDALAALSRMQGVQRLSVLLLPEYAKADSKMAKWGKRKLSAVQD